MALLSIRSKERRSTRVIGSNDMGTEYNSHHTDRFRVYIQHGMDDGRQIDLSLKNAEFVEIMKALGERRMKNFMKEAFTND